MSGGGSSVGPPELRRVGLKGPRGWQGASAAVRSCAQTREKEAVRLNCVSFFCVYVHILLICRFSLYGKFS